MSAPNGDFALTFNINVDRKTLNGCGGAPASQKSRIGVEVWCSPLGEPLSRSQELPRPQGDNQGAMAGMWMLRPSGKSLGGGWFIECASRCRLSPRFERPFRRGSLVRHLQVWTRVGVCVSTGIKGAILIKRNPPLKNLIGGDAVRTLYQTLQSPEKWPNAN